MKKFLKDNLKLMTGFVVLACIIPIIILTPSSYGIFSSEVGGILVSYCGALLGGFLTLYGVWWTIEKNKEDKRNEISIQYMPILEIKNKKINFFSRRLEDPEYDIDDDNEQPYIVKMDYYYEYEVGCEIDIENMGRGEVVEALISCVKDNKFIKVNYDSRTTFVLPEKCFKIRFNINLREYEIMKNEGFYSCLDIEIKYFDIMNKEHLNTIPVYISIQEPNQYFDEEKNQVETDYNNLEYSIGDIKRNKF